MIKMVLISDKYINFLRIFDKNVCYNKGQKRPYIGVLVTVNNRDYYAPLSSPKPKFAKMQNDVDFMKIDGGNLGAINFNNMIPVVNNSIKPILVKNITDPKYKILVAKQLSWLNKKEPQIVYRANKLYTSYKGKTLRAAVTARCCNFLLLEKKSRQFNPQHNKKVP